MTDGPVVGRIDWVSATDEASWHTWVERAVELTDGGEVEVVPGRWFYDTCYRVGGVIEVYADPRDRATMPATCVAVRGEGCAWLGHERLQRIVRWAAKLTRVDVAIDGAGFTPAMARQAWRAGDRRTRSTAHKWHEEVKRGVLSSTFELGSRQTVDGRRLVIYDKRGPTRVELRSKGQRAELLREVVLGPSEGLVVATLGLVRDMVDFVERASATNVGRAVLLPWWADFVGAVERVGQAVVRRTAPSVERRVAWLRASVAPTLAALVGGGLDVDELLGDGRRRMRARHRALRHQLTAVSLGVAVAG